MTRRKTIQKRDTDLNTVADEDEVAQETRIKNRANRQKANKEDEEKIKQERIKAEKETEIFAAREEAKLKAEQQKAKIEELNSERARLQEELSLRESREQAAKAKAALAEAEAISSRVIGEAEASITRAKALAEKAQLLQTQHELLEALPKMLDKIAATSSKTGEVKVMYLGGPSQAGGGLGDPNLAGLISGVSSLSILRELLQFVGDWNAGGQQKGSDAGGSGNSGSAKSP